MSLITTLSDPTSNSYADITYADAYFADHWDLVKAASWDDLSNSKKEQVLIQATSILETLPYWMTTTAINALTAIDIRKVVVSPSVTGQALAFPRNIDWDGSAYYIPIDIKMAECEQAIFMVNSMNETTMQARTQGIIAERVKAGDVETSTNYEANGGLGFIQGSISPIAYILVKKYIIKGSRMARQ